LKTAGSDKIAAMKFLLILLIVLFSLVYARCRPAVPTRFREPDEIVKVKTTGYCACMKCCGWKLNRLGLPVYASGRSKGNFKIIGQTAGGRMARAGTVAVDPKIFPFGTVFHIPGYGWARAEDTGGDIKGRHLDLFFFRHQTASEWGVQTLTVRVWYPEHKGK